MLSTFPSSLLQVRGGQQGLFSRSTDARCPGEGLGHVGGLSGEHLCEGPPAPLGSLCHYLLPSRLPPSKREQVSQIPSKGDKMGTKKEVFCANYNCGRQTTTSSNNLHKISFNQAFFFLSQISSE